MDTTDQKNLAWHSILLCLQPRKATKIHVVKEFRLGRNGASDWPGDPREWEHKHGTTAELTSLGKKLLGAESW